MMAAKFKVGDAVRLKSNGKLGVVAYSGATKFAPGSWVGVELEEPDTGLDLC